jgi:co-chaperonin GroES (HSP10)
VLIRRKDAETKKGLLYIPATAQEKALEGTVVAVGRGICNYKNGSWRELSVKVGDAVFFENKYVTDGSEVTIDDEKFVVLREMDLAAVIDP